jgi:hypothetical protein
MEVLGRYFQEPSRYHVSDTAVNCLDLWYLPIDVTEEDLVQVWLGDLGKIPYKEQLHWRQQNVVPKGTITRHRFLRDFLAQFADPVNDPMYLFRVAYEEVQRESLAQYGENLFLMLDSKDMHVHETLHLPITAEWKEFDEQVHALAKLTVDSLNVRLLSRETNKSIDGIEIKGSVDLLHVFLGRLDIEKTQEEEVIRAFRAVQSLRSTGTAHRKGSQFEKALKKLQLENLSNRAKVKTLVVRLSRALSILAAGIRSRYEP